MKGELHDKNEYYFKFLVKLSTHRQTYNRYIQSCANLVQILGVPPSYLRDIPTDSPICKRKSLTNALTQMDANEDGNTGASNGGL